MRAPAGTTPSSREARVTCGPAPATCAGRATSTGQLGACPARLPLGPGVLQPGAVRLKT